MIRVFGGGGGSLNPMVTQDDIIVGGAGGAPARLAKGADGQTLTVDPISHHLAYATLTGETSWTALTFQNGASAFGAPFAVPGYRKDGSGVVHLQGMVTQGTAFAVQFTLPVGYRPLHDADMVVWTSSGSPQRCTVHADGTFTSDAGAGGTNVSLEGLTFYSI